MEKEDLWKLHTLSSDMIKVADSKAIFVIGVIGIITTLFGSLSDFKIPVLINNTFTLTLLFSSGFFSLFSSLIAIYSLYSILDTKEKQKSNLFFGDIAANKNLQIFKNGLTENYNIEEDLTGQIFIISKIADKKHKLLQFSIAFLGFAIITFATSILTTIFLK